MRNILIVVDMQKDFVTGALASAEAQAILPEVKAKISAYNRAGKEIIFTRDTHGEDYMQTNEGKHLPVPHCIKGTDGWQICSTLTDGLFGQMDGRSVQSLPMESLRNIRPLTSRHSGS